MTPFVLSLAFLLTCAGMTFGAVETHCPPCKCPDDKAGVTARSLNDDEKLDGVGSTRSGDDSENRIKPTFNNEDYFISYIKSDKSRTRRSTDPSYGGNYGNQPYGGKYGNQPYGGNYGNQPYGGNYGNQPYGGSYGNQQYGSNYGNQPYSGGSYGGNYGNQQPPLADAWWYKPYDPQRKSYQSDLGYQALLGIKQQFDTYGVPTYFEPGKYRGYQTNGGDIENYN